MDRAERRWRTSKTVNRRVRNMKKIFPSWPFSLENDYRKQIIGSCKKKAPLDCGHSHCEVCHFSKIFNVLKIADQRANLDLKEQLHEQPFFHPKTDY